MQNRRSAVRMKIDREAEILTPDGSVNIACRLRDLSARGAKLTLSDHDGLPEHVVLHIPRDGTSWPCQIMRRRRGEIGVLFT